MQDNNSKLGKPELEAMQAVPVRERCLKCSCDDCHDASSAKLHCRAAILIAGELQRVTVCQPMLDKARLCSQGRPLPGTEFSCSQRAGGHLCAGPP